VLIVIVLIVVMLVLLVLAMLRVKIVLAVPKTVMARMNTKSVPCTTTGKTLGKYEAR
jgi:hypothetical protein